MPGLPRLIVAGSTCQAIAHCLPADKARHRVSALASSKNELDVPRISTRNMKWCAHRPNQVSASRLDTADTGRCSLAVKITDDHICPANVVDLILNLQHVKLDAVRLLMLSY